MSNKRYVKLGSKALSFFDPVSRMILAVGEATTLTPDFRQSKRVTKALRSGHLEYVDRDELENYTIVSGLEEETETPEAPAPKEPETTDTNWMDEFELEEKKLAKLKLSQLQELATYYGVDMEEEEIQNATKAELILALLDLEDEDE